jgi:hypothetical protein
MLFSKWWRRYKQRLDKHFMGPAIDKVVRERNAPERYKHLVWAVHKLREDSIYGPEDLTDEEKRALAEFCLTLTKQKRD